MTVSPPLAEPASDRLGHLDFLRGMALLGILVMNIQSFAMPFDAMMRPTEFGMETPLDYSLWLTAHLFVFTKAMAAFTLLFGMGIIMQSDRLTTTGRSPARIFYRRVGVLAVFGLLHAYLFWYGDILFMYAVIGAIAFLLRTLKPGWLITIGATAYAVGALMYGALTGLAYAIPEVGESLISYAASAADLQAEIDAYRGTYLHQMPQRAREAIMMQAVVLPFQALPMNGGLMLIGMALWKFGLFAPAVAARSLIAVASLALAIGLLIASLDAYLLHTFAGDDPTLYLSTLSQTLVLVGSPFLAIGYLATLMLLHRTLPSGVTLPLRSAGQMALSGYLLTTLICTTIYYGHGFGLFMHHTRTQQFVVVLGVWAVLLVASTFWLRHFKLGPFEWVWRSLTYGTRPPMRRQPTQP
jgi:uncharacterized protein